MPRVATPGSSRQRVYEELRRRVLTLQLPPGAALSENELAADLGVSRTPIRESLILLADEGLVQVFPKIGSFVSPVDPDRVADAQFLREAVELAALADLPATLDPDLLQHLRDNLEQQRSPTVDLEAFFALDEAFHHGLLRLSGHGGAWPTVVSAKGHLDRARRLGLQGRSWRPLADQHLQIFTSVVAGDVDRARTGMRGHLRAVFDDIEEIRTTSPQLFAAPTAAAPVRRYVAVWQ